jgi:hypothetical protein
MWMGAVDRGAMKRDSSGGDLVVFRWVFGGVLVVLPARPSPLIEI